MTIKKLFDKGKTKKVKKSESIQTTSKEVESKRHLEVELEEHSRFVPHVDFATASHFAVYGLAEKYYVDSVDKICSQYPYDGSLYEKSAWDVSASYVDKWIFENKPINIFNYGNMQRDFTYIDDIVEGIFRCCFKKPQLSDFESDKISGEKKFSVPHQIFNIGNSKPIELLDFIKILEEKIGIKAIKNFKEIQSGDVVKTYANTEKLNSWIDYSPCTRIDKGVELFIKWYKHYYKY